MNPLANASRRLQRCLPALWLCAALLLGCGLWPEARSHLSDAPGHSPPTRATPPDVGIPKDPLPPTRAATETPPPSSPSPPPLTPHPTPDLTAQLAQNPMPAADPISLAAGLLPTEEDPPRAGHAAPQPTGRGVSRSFWVGDLQAGRMRLVDATLRVQTEHVEMWVENGASVDDEALQDSARILEEHILPTVRASVVPDWHPGTDDNPRLAVLNVHITGVAGYFAAANLYPREVTPYSNEREMFVMNLSAVTPGTVPYNRVLAHELQHMIHWHVNPGQEAWVNEGVSQLAEDISGYGWPVAAVAHYTGDPDLQLNTWADDRYTVAAHYGASYLMMRYLLDRHGRAAVQELVREPAGGIEGFDRVLRRMGDESFDDFFADWLVANLLDDPYLDDGRYGYPEIDVAARPRHQVRDFPRIIDDAVRQYGTHYIELWSDTPGTLRVSFEGAAEARLVPNRATSGEWQWWSNRGDAGHSYLEREFDLTGVASATLRYNIWHDIESGWDFAYVRASTDGGLGWTLLRSAHMIDENPMGYALGPGYTGISGGGEVPIWVNDEVDLTPFAGQVVRVRFDYVTDDAIHGSGLCLDDFELEAARFRDDVEEGDEGWTAVGFIRHNNHLPQGYILRAVEFGAEPGVTHIHDVTVDADGRAEWEWNFGDEAQRIILIISAVAPATIEPADYSLLLQHIPHDGRQSLLLPRQHRAQVEKDPVALDAGHHRRGSPAQGTRQRVSARVSARVSTL